MLTKPIYGRLFFDADKGDGGGGGDSAATTTDPKAATETPPKQEESAKVTFSAEQQAVIDALIGSARKEGKAAAEKSAADARAAADEERKRQELEAKGQFDEVKASLSKERDDAIGARDGLQAKVEAYETLAKARVEEGRKALPAEALEDFPADADPLDQLNWLETREKLVAKLVPQNGANGGTRIPRTPGATGNGSQITKEQQAAYDRQYQRTF